MEVDKIKQKTVIFPRPVSALEYGGFLEELLLSGDLNSVHQFADRIGPVVVKQNFATLLHKNRTYTIKPIERSTPKPEYYGFELGQSTDLSTDDQAFLKMMSERAKEYFVEAKQRKPFLNMIWDYFNPSRFLSS